MRETVPPDASLAAWRQTVAIQKLERVWRRRRVLFAAAVRRIRRSRARVLPGICAAGLNILLLAVVVIGLRLPRTPGENELHLVLSPVTRTVVAERPAIPDVDIPIVQMPEIVIQQDTSDAPPAVSASLVLAPRPDPLHPNPMPESLKSAEQGAVSGSVILKILVLPDGTVADATVVQTSGKQDTDAAVMALVKTEWKFLPALLEGKPIKYWTTVAVRLA